MIVATAGHIDHGKTSLVKALTGVDTDRLPEEKARGISIDIGFAYRDVPRGGSIGFVDVPGHERFVRNMLAGVCGIDYAMLVVAADDGIMPQTREHLNILDLLAIRSGIAVLTKIDRVPPQRVAEVRREVEALLGPTSLRDSPIVACSARTRAGLGEVQACLDGEAAHVLRRAHAGAQFRYAIDRAFTVAGSGTVVTGTVFDGRVAVGERLLLSPSGLPVRVRGLQVQGRQVQSAIAGERCALNLAGVSLSRVDRGDWLLHPELHEPTSRMDARIAVLAAESEALKHWSPVHLHLGTRDVTARIALRRGESIRPGGSALSQVVLDQPIAALHGDRFIIRDQSATRTLGGGVVLDPWAHRRRNQPQRARQLDALEQTSPADSLRMLSECSAAGVSIRSFRLSFNLDDSAMRRLLEQEQLGALGKGDAAVALPAREIERLREGTLLALRHFHDASPQKDGMEIGALAAASAPSLSGATFLSLLRNMAEAQLIELSGALARLASHSAAENAPDRRTWEMIKVPLRQAGHGGLVITELAAAAGCNEAILRDFLPRYARSGLLVRVAPERFYLCETMESFAAVAAGLASSAPNARFTAAHFKDEAGIGRNLCIKVLEALDRIGVTRRIGDDRVVIGTFSAAGRTPKGVEG